MFSVGDKGVSTPPMVSDAFFAYSRRFRQLAGNDLTLTVVTNVARPVKLFMGEELLEVWRQELRQLKCEEQMGPGLENVVMAVIEVTRDVEPPPAEAVRSSELPVIVVTDFSRPSNAYLEQIRNRVVGLCDRESAAEPARVQEYIKTGLLLARTFDVMKDQKIIWTAKTTLMKNYHLSEAEAHRRLQTASMKTGRNLREISQAVITAEEMAGE